MASPVSAPPRRALFGSGRFTNAHSSVSSWGKCEPTSRFCLARDERAARGYFEEAAKTDPIAMFEFGAYLRDGRGGPRDAKEARSWFQVAAAAGVSEAHLALATFDRPNVEQREQDVFRWLNNAADAGNVTAMLTLGRQLLNTGSVSNKQIAVGWFERASNAGETTAMLELAKIYLLANRTGEARAWLEAAAKSKSREAMLLLARDYQKGEKAPQDPAQAARWFKEAADCGDAEAMYEYSLILDKTQKTRGREEAIRWMSKSAELGNSGARVWLSKHEMRRSLIAKRGG
jgi:TPR repeat protein